jgi:hypothetical protein
VSDFSGTDRAANERADAPPGGVPSGCFYAPMAARISWNFRPVFHEMNRFPRNSGIE